jgi:cysteine-rich repeat protein
MIADLKLRRGAADQGGCLLNIGGPLQIRNVVFENCEAEEGGGAIYNDYELSIYDSTIEGCNGGWAGGGISTDWGTTTIVRTSVLGCTAEYGGGLASEGEVLLVDSLLAHNEAVLGGGGIDNSGTMHVIRSTIAENRALGDDGGGIMNYGELAVATSTISGNQVVYSDGGGLYNAGTLTLESSTLTLNDGYGGGFKNRGDATLGHNIIAGNFWEFADDPDDCDEGSGTLTSQGHNLLGVGSGCPSLADPTDLAGTYAAPIDPGLGTLSSNGGPTQTHALMPGSPAIDAGALSGCGPVDQRGVPRPVDGDGDTLPVCDIGAFEVASAMCSDPARTDELSGGCSERDGDPSACVAAFEVSDLGGARSCYASGTGQCLACTPERESSELCVNTCNALCEDLSRTRYAGESADGSVCSVYYGDPVECERTFYMDSESLARSCFYDDTWGDCLGCTVERADDAECYNACVPSPCLDPARPLPTNACQDFSGDQTLCEASYVLVDELRACYFGPGGVCLACGEADLGRGDCANTCAALPCQDETLVNAGSEQAGGCARHDGDPVACDGAFQTALDGSFESCSFDAEGLCRGCDPTREAGGTCVNACGSTVCGNGRLFGDESCDDGNLLDGDGCSQICRVEPGYQCTDEPSFCFASTHLSPAQQSCVNDMLKQGAALAKAQNKESLKCVKNASRGRLDDLAAPGQTATADACLTNDVRGRIARRQGKLLQRQVDSCLSAPEQSPDWCYAGGATILAASSAECGGLTRDLLGAVLQTSVADHQTQRVGAKCQQEVLKRTNALYDELWNLSVREVKTSLNRGDSSPRTAAELGALLVDAIERDERGKLARKRRTLGVKTAKRCGGVTLSGLFTGACDTATDVTQLTTCAETRAGCRFCRSLNAFGDLTVNCDLFDDATPNDSCP